MSKQCLYCQVPLQNNSSQSPYKKYCSKLHKKYYNRKKAALQARVQQKRANLPQNDEILYLVKQCRYAGTVQILKGHTLNSFVETMQLVKNRPAADVDLSHIAPVKGKGAVGLFHCQNLAYCGRHQNKKFGNRYYSGGLSIKTSSLKAKWSVYPEMSANEVLHLIEEYLGDIVQRYLEIIPVRKSKRVQVALKIIEHGGSETFDQLMCYHYKALLDKLTALTGVLGFKPIKPDGQSKFKVYMDGISRLIGYGVANESNLREVRKILVIGYMALERVEYSSTFNWDFYLDYEPLIDIEYGQAMLVDPDNWSEFKDLLYDAAFKSIHGAHINLDKLRTDVMSHLHFPIQAWKVTNWNVAINKSINN